jgi:O-antigen ligase
MTSLQTQQRISSLLLIVGPLMSLAITPSINYDPINLIKLVILATIGLACFGIVLGEFKSSVAPLPKLFLISVFAFLCSLFISFVFSGAPLSQQLWGSFGRNTGLLTYISLVGVLLSASTIRSREFSEKLIWSLIFTNIPMAVYCIIQIAELDPVAWSSYEPFGTLGNVNFLSAFLGMCATASSLLTLKKNLETSKRLWLLLLTLINVFIIIQTESIQGLIVFASGVAVGAFFLVRDYSQGRSSLFSISYLVAMLISGVMFALALFNQGPLAKFIFQQTLVFRLDYMRAAVEMMKEKPFTGVGLDSYGDWYRSSRDIFAAFRTSLNRTSNTAHNIFLDVGSNVGVLGLIAYVGFIAMVAFYSMRKLFSSKDLDLAHTIIFSVWVGYLVQSLASINQIGVGIWGWIFSGALLGHVFISENQEKSEIRLRLKRGKKMPNQLRPLSAVLGFIGMVVGFSLAVVPTYADMKFQEGNASLNLTTLMDASKLPGSTAIHLGKTIEIANNNNYVFQAKEMNDLLISQYPREIFGWTIRRTLDNPSADVYKDSTINLEQLDPFAAICLKPDSATLLFQLFQRLSPRDQLEIVRYWNLPAGAVSDVGRPFLELTPGLQIQLAGFCQR